MVSCFWTVTIKNASLRHHSQYCARYRKWCALFKLLLKSISVENEIANCYCSKMCKIDIEVSLLCLQILGEAIVIMKHVSVKTNSGQMHLNAVGHEGAAVFAHVARSAHMHLHAVIFNWKQHNTQYSSLLSKTICLKTLKVSSSALLIARYILRFGRDVICKWLFFFTTLMCNRTTQKNMINS